MLRKIWGKLDWPIYIKFDTNEIALGLFDRLAIELAAANHSPVSGAEAANEVFKQALSQDLGDEDFSAVYKAVQNNSSDKH